MSKMGSMRNAVASGSGTPIPLGQQVDLYKSLPKYFQKELGSMIPPTSYSSPPSVASTLGISPEIWSSRVAYKNLLLSGDPPQTVSELVKGKKRNRGYPALRAEAARGALQKQKEREEDGIIGERKRRKILKSSRHNGEGLTVVKKGKSDLTYQSLLPLHHLHNVYVSQLLSLPPFPPLGSDIPKKSLIHNPESIQSHLLKADFTGSFLAVKASRNPDLGGIRGIVIEETSGTFRIICEDDKIRIIPKPGTQFTLSFPAYGPPSPQKLSTEDEEEEVVNDVGEYLDPEEVDRWFSQSPRVEIDLMGGAFGYRSGERAGRKFRPAQGNGGGSGWGEEWVRGPWKDVLDLMEPSGARKSKNVKGGSVGKGIRKRGKSRRKDGIAWGRVVGVP